MWSMKGVLMEMIKDKGKEDDCAVLDPPNIVKEIVVGEFTFELNDIDELRISNKYEPTTFVLGGVEMGVLQEIIKLRIKQ